MTLMNASQLHRSWYVSDIEHNIFPALQTGQCKIYLDDDGLPTACVTWALVNDEDHEALLQKGQTPPPERWAIGRNLWFIDAIAPFANPIGIVRDLQRNYFAHHSCAHAVRRNCDGGIRRIQTWRNPMSALVLGS